MTLDRIDRPWLSPLILALILALAALFLHDIDAAGRIPPQAILQQVGMQVAGHMTQPSAYLPLTVNTAPDNQKPIFAAFQTFADASAHLQ